MPFVSVAVCTYNRSDLLERTLDRMQQLVVPSDSSWELLIVNNACTDDTDALIARWANRLPLRRLFEPKPGQCAARNCAMRHARGDVILWTDDDVLVDPDWMRALASGLTANQAQVVFGKSKPHWLGQQPEWYSPLHHGRFAISDYGNKSFVAKDLSQMFYGLNFGITRASLQQLGGFDETLGFGPNGGIGGDDTDLFRRAVAADLKIVYIPEAVVEHLIPPARTTKDFYRHRVDTSVPREYDLLHQHFSGVPWVAGLPRFLVRQAASDAVAYLVSRVTLAKDRTFHYELRLRRFAGFMREARRWRRDEFANKVVS